MNKNLNRTYNVRKKQKKICKIMKISFIISFICLFQLSATVYSQNGLFTIETNNTTLRELFHEIEQQSSFRFFYNDVLIDIDQKVSIDVSDKRIDELMDIVLANSGITYRILDNRLIVVSPVALLQQLSITGVVTDTNGDPLPGVSILIKGTTQGTATDSNGAYSMTVPNENATLVFSFIGFVSQEILTGNRHTINVTLVDDTRQLEEVVVVGYGTVKKANLTGAVGQIGGKQLVNRSVPYLSQALEGKVAGLNVTTDNGAPGSTQSINLRGYTGLGTRAEPLIVIDGIQGGNLQLEMNDVESISFLKDAASAAIYGSNAPYGVIIVTTKKGSAGKPIINYNNNLSLSQPINLPHYVNSLDFAYFVREGLENSNLSMRFDEAHIQRIKDYQAGIITSEVPADLSSDIWMGSGGMNANNDWFDICFKKASFSQQHNISISGTNESFNYYGSLGYTQQDGLYNWADEVYKRYNTRVNLSSNLTKWLTVGMRGAFFRAYTDVPTIYGGFTGGVDYSTDYMYLLGKDWPTFAHKNPDGNYNHYSPALGFINGGRNKVTTDNAMLTGEFIVRPLQGWEITANYTYNGYYLDNIDHKKTFYQVLPSGKLDPRSGTSPNSIYRGFTKNQVKTINAFTSYEIMSNGGHYFNLLAGFTQVLQDNLNMTGSNNYLYTDEIPMLSMTYGDNRAVNDGASQLATRGVFGRINYSYKEKYLLELNGRYDGTSRFMKNNRMKFYPGVSGAWVASKELFWEPIRDYVNQFKLRASYASLGDNAFTSNYYPFYPSLGNASPTGTTWLYSGGRESAFWQPGLVNYDLTWVTVNTLGLGIDIAALNNRLEFSFDWYNRGAKDFVGPAERFPALLGTGAPNINNAEIETKGFEITLGWRDQIGEIAYGALFVLSDYTGKVLKYNNPTKILSDVWYDGMTMGEIWGYETVGLFKDQAEIDATDQSYFNANWYVGDVHYKDLNGDGKINIGTNTLYDPGDRKVIGNTTPRYSFGLTLNAEWKGFDALVFLQGVCKRDFMFESQSNFFWGAVTNELSSSYFTLHTDRWTKDNPNGYLPRIYFNTDKNRQAQTRYLQNAAYLRVKNIQLGYSLPKEITNKIKFQKARIFVNIENLATFTKLMNIIDPDIVNQNAKVYPLRRMWAIGTNITF